MRHENEPGSRARWCSGRSAALTLLDHGIPEAVAVPVDVGIPDRLHLGQGALALAHQGLRGPGHAILGLGRRGAVSGRMGGVGGVGGGVRKGGGAGGDHVPEGADEELFGVDCHGRHATDRSVTSTGPGQGSNEEGV